MARIAALDIGERRIGVAISDATQTLAIFSFKLSFKLFDFGHGAAVGNVLVLISLFFAYFYIRSFRRQLETDAS